MLRKTFGTLIATVFALALVGFVPQARATGQRQQRTLFSFNKPVQLPQAAILPAGKYLFLTPNPMNGGTTVEVWNADQTKLMGTFETITNQRPDPDRLGTIELRVGTEPERPPLVIGWVYPGQIQGHTFVYSSQKENRLLESGKLVTVQIQSGGTVTIG